MTTVKSRKNIYTQCIEKIDTTPRFKVSVTLRIPITVRPWEITRISETTIVSVAQLETLRTSRFAVTLQCRTKLITPVSHQNNGQHPMFSKLDNPYYVKASPPNANTAGTPYTANYSIGQSRATPHHANFRRSRRLYTAILQRIARSRDTLTTIESNATKWRFLKRTHRGHPDYYNYTSGG